MEVLERTRPGLRSAWVAAVLQPVASLVTIAVAEGVMSWLGYEDGGKPVPASVLFGVVVPLLVLSVLPGIAAVVLGRRVALEGDRRGWVPAGIGGALVLLMVLTNLPGLVTSLR